MTQKAGLIFLFLFGFVSCTWGQSSESASFQESFVRVSEENPYYFELSNGETYIPNGLNLCWARDMDVMETYFRKLSENGGNFARIWLNYPQHEIELEYGKVDEANFSNLERILEMAVRYHIKLKLCIESFRIIAPEKGFFTKSQYYKENGGPFADMDDFINSELGHQAYLNRLSVLKSRFGDHPAIFGWELWNEMNAIESGGLRDWNDDMLPKVRELFPKNMVMQSLGSFDSNNPREDYRYINRLASNDVAQIHRYLDLGASLDICKGPMDLLASDAISELRSYGVNKPMLLAEVGGVKPKHTGPIEVYAADKEGMLFHDMLFAPFFSGAAGPGHAWHWDSYVDKNDLWYHIQRFGKAIKGIDPVKEKFVVSQMDHESLRIYVLSGTEHTLLWCRDIYNDWENELVNGVEPLILKGIELNLTSLTNHQRIRGIELYDPWTGKWTSANKSKHLKLPDFRRSLIVKVTN